MVAADCNNVALPHSVFSLRLFSDLGGLDPTLPLRDLVTFGRNDFSHLHAKALPARLRGTPAL